MCLAIPGKILGIEDDEHGMRMARASFGGVVRSVCLACTPEAQPDDYVLVHVGFAIGVIDEAEAKKTLAALRELGELDELEAAVESKATRHEPAAPPPPAGAP